MADNIRADGLMGGDRLYKGKGLGDVGAWKCPACLVENSGPISAGCVSCGAGSAQPSHVGVPEHPLRRKGTTPLRGRPLDDDGAIEFQRPLNQSSADQSISAQAFDRWFEDFSGEEVKRAEMFEAWKNGIAWYRAYLVRTAQQTDEPAPDEDPNVVAVPRELLRAVLKQLEDVIDIPETESQSPELLALISRVRELAE